MPAQFKQFFSVDSPKAIKARKLGYLNAINYMAPARTAGVGNLCPHASPGCLALCLGWYSGQAAMLSNAKLETGINPVRASRVRKAQLFMHDRPAFLREMVRGVEASARAAQRQGLRLCVRLNGATDIAWEGLAPFIFASNPGIQFVDYTKSVKRALRHATDKTWPANYHLTFSRSETNEVDCQRVLAAGGNVAVVSSRPQPTTWQGYPVINGDESDLRHLDPKNYVVWLTPKGRKAKADRSGMVLR